MKDNDNSVQLSTLLKGSTPQYVMSEVKRIFQFSYPASLFSRVLGNFKNVVSLFDGKFQGYQGCNTEYHNLGHSLDALLASMRLIDGYNLSEGKMNEKLTVDLLLAALFHDTGYIQEDWDKNGTGAKYTKSHVERSIEFIRNNSGKLMIDKSEEDIIAHIISCTGLQMRWVDISFSSKQEEIAGAILGASDLLGQMADRLYLEKLLFLYNEFKEAGIQGYETEFDIIRKTAAFYAVTAERLKKDLLSVHELARVHFRERFGIDRNLYMEAIEKHMDYLKKIIDDGSSNFRSKLKRKSSYTSAVEASVH